MSLSPGQDPAGHFDYANLTWTHNTAYDHPLAFILTTGWFFVLVLAGFLVAARRVEPFRFGRKPIRILLAASAALLFLPMAGAVLIQKQGGPPDSIPHFAGHLQGEKTADYAGELGAWAKSRYGLDLTTVQARELQTKESRGLFVPTNRSRPVIHDGSLIHGIIAADQIILVDKAGTELPLAPAG